MRGLWFLTVYHGVRHTFPMRWLEWLMSIFIIVWGDSLLGRSSSPLWNSMIYWFPLWVWGWSMMTVGVLRLIALGINGTFRNTLYSRYSPMVRGLTAGFCGLLWLAVALSAAAMLPLFFFILEMFVAYFVIGEAGAVTRAARHGRG